MNLRMGAAVAALAGLFVSAYLWLYKLGAIGTLSCGTGGCETVQLSPQSRFLGVEVAAIGVAGYAVAARPHPRIPAAPVGRFPPSAREHRRARRGRRGLHALSQVSRAVRHPRDLPVVRRLGDPDRRVLHSHTARDSPGAPPGDMSASGGTAGKPRGKALAGLALGALGVVYGDIGTSPLYALKECFGGVYSVPLTHDNVLGVLSLVFWSLNFVVTFKYLTVMPRGQPRGRRHPRPAGAGRRRGKATRSAARSSRSDSSARRCSTATASSPRRSRCSARSKGWAWRPTARAVRSSGSAVVIIALIFGMQSRGTARVGRIFGPVTHDLVRLHRDPGDPRHLARARGAGGDQPGARGPDSCGRRACQHRRARRPWCWS